MRTIPERVRAGIIYLRTCESEEVETPEGMRKVHPELKGWPTKIDLKTLNIADPETCVMGQLYGSYAQGVNTLSLFATYSYGYGFLAHPDGEAMGLTEEWRRQLAAMSGSAGGRTGGRLMDNVRLIFTDDDLWVYPEGDGDIHYTTLVGANLDVHSVTIPADKLEQKQSEIAEQFPEVTWHDMREGEEPPADSLVVVYDDPDEFLGDFLSPQWPPPD